MTNSFDPGGQQAAYRKWIDLPESQRRKMQQLVGMSLFGATAGCCEVCDLLVRVRDGVGGSPTWRTDDPGIHDPRPADVVAEDEMIEIEVVYDGQPQTVKLPRREFEARLRTNA